MRAKKSVNSYLSVQKKTVKKLRSHEDDLYTCRGEAFGR